MNQSEQNTFLLSTFREEIDGHVVNLTREFIELEEASLDNSRADRLREIMRILHTIKGAARMMGFPPITRVAHVMEELIGYYRDCQPPVEIPHTAIDVLFEGLDVISETTREATRNTPGIEANPITTPEIVELLIAKIAVMAGRPALAQDASQPPAPNGLAQSQTQNLVVEPTEQLIFHSHQTPAFPVEAATLLENSNEPRSERTNTQDETIRVRLDKLDDLINLAGELVINKQQNEEHLEILQELTRQSRQRSRMTQQLREYIIERTPIDERNRLLGITELFSFEQPEMPDWVRQDLQPNAEYGLQTSRQLAVTTEREGYSTHSTEIFGLDAKGLRKVFDRLEEIIELDTKLERQLTQVLRERKAYNLRFGTAADELRRNMLGIRMLPLDTIFGRFVRPVRDLAYERGKEVKLVVTGGAIEVDKRILEQIADPLVHMLRNSIDHGIETPQARQASGKSVEGTLTLSAMQKGSHVVIQVQDDGCGINPQSLRKAAVSKGYMDELTAQALSDEAVLDLIYRAGFSTRARPDEVSGRGIGMDVVQQNIKRLNGRILVQSQVGQGTTFQLEIPLTLATVDALIIQVAGQLFALPSVMVAGMVRHSRQELQTVEGRSVVRLRGQLVPVVPLNEILSIEPLAESGLNRPDDNAEFFQGVLISAGIGGTGQETTERLICFEVENLVDEREVVVKGLGSFLDKTPNIAGVTVLGADGLALILDLFGLVQSVRLGHSITSQPFQLPDQPTAPRLLTRRAHRILVVDDSLATRELERSILETAGFKVDTARDGLEALKACHAQRPDLVLSDVEMPNMDGFRLSAAIRQDSRLNNLPIIIVSSRDSAEDRRKGMEAGAQAYIVKGQFEQNKLLETITRLIV